MDAQHPADNEEQLERGEMIDTKSVAEGTIDHIFDVLNRYRHPFILVGATAHRWMGCAGVVDEGFDMVIRNDQLKAIVADLIATGHWTLFDPNPERKVLESDPLREVYERGRKLLLDYCYDADAALKSIGPLETGFGYLRLWSDDTYRIKVDLGPFVEVPELHPWSVFLVEEQCHPALQREDGWWYGPNILSKADDSSPVFSPILPRAKGLATASPIFIPSIPAYVDALVYQRTHYKYSKPELSSAANWQIGNLTRYLYLELSHQKNALLFQIDAEAENYMQPYLECYKRKPRYYLTSEKQSILVKEWDPETYPEDIRSKWTQNG